MPLIGNLRYCTMNKISRSLIQWYDKNAYDFPWRKTTDVYKIWISEIMLQQTQVTTVVDYYNRVGTLLSYRLDIF